MSALFWILVVIALVVLVALYLITKKKGKGEETTPSVPPTPSTKEESGV